MDRVVQQVASRIATHLRCLTADIGERLTGSAGEAQAAEYIAEAFRRHAATVTTEPVPVLQRCVRHESLEIRIDGQWHAYPCSLFSNTPGTDGSLVTAPLVLFEAPTGYQRDDLDFLRGKAVIHLGCHIESRDAYRRLMAAEPAFLLFVDIRYPGAVPLADGMFPAYTRDLGAKPTLNVAYMDAWEWQRIGADAARIRVDAEMQPSTSRNVIAEFPGAAADSGVIYCGAHHDTQAGTVGADDNASGVVSLLAMAECLAGSPRRHTIRLISFGAEEQLSVGSAHYVRMHREAVSTAGRFMFNLDSCGTLMGWNELNGNGPETMIPFVTECLAAHDILVNADSAVIPYTDQFPFAAAGVPGVWFGRRNCAAGRFFHHRHDDTVERLSCDMLARHSLAFADLIRKLGAMEKLPFAADIPETQKNAIESCWQDLYGGWKGLKTPSPTMLTE